MPQLIKEENYFDQEIENSRFNTSNFQNIIGDQSKFTNKQEY